MLEENQKLCYDRLTLAFSRLEQVNHAFSDQIINEKIMRIAQLIAEAMTGQWRHFHTTTHVLEVGNSDNAIEMLAGLFHDLIYVQADQSIAINQSYYLAPFIKEHRNQLIVRNTTLPEDAVFNLVACIFAIKPAQILSPFTGLNEFLSALFCAKALQELLSMRQIAEICVCIEATIPFRGIDEHGRSMADNLHFHLQQANQDFALGYEASQLEQVVKYAVKLTNRDVDNFATDDPAHFLDNTWHLLPETNHVLQNPSTYTVNDYRMTLQKMEGFMSQLDPHNVFQRYQDEPSEADYQAWFSNAERNIQIARLYLRAKLVSISVLEALSLRFSQHIPVAFLMGELPSENQNSIRLEEFLFDPPSPWQASNAEEQTVFILLSKGRNEESFYDLKHSPLATFMIKHIGLPKVLALYQRATLWFSGDISAEDFLSTCEPKMLQCIINSLTELLSTREAALLQQPLKQKIHINKDTAAWRIKLAKWLLKKA
jgi:hypothetical protein